jgi:hypothetical protein
VSGDEWDVGGGAETMWSMKTDEEIAVPCTLLYPIG